MSANQHDLGEIDEIDVEAIGEPGHRTFRLLIERGPTTVSLWMEKEQLQQLAAVVIQNVASVHAATPTPEPPTLTLASRFASTPTIDLQVGRMTIGFDAEIGRFVLTASPREDPPDLLVSCVLALAQAEALGAKIATVTAAGRPRCPLCGAPIEMEGQHVCPASNGHVHP